MSILVQIGVQFSDYETTHFFKISNNKHYPNYFFHTFYVGRGDSNPRCFCWKHKALADLKVIGMHYPKYML